MRRKKLLLLLVAAVVGPVLALWGQSDKDQPHGDIKIDCGDCHNPEKWTPVTKPPVFRHDSTGFALQDAHSQVSCRACHRSLEFSKVGTSCADCHRDAHRGELGARCEQCHEPRSWTNQREIFRVHAGTRFPLMAVHARLDCAACHRNQRPYEYRNTPAECGNCHYQDYLGARSPNHVQSGFPRSCENCHLSTANSWHEARFSHETFPLVGGHGGLACLRCHGAGAPKPGLSTECISCHQSSFASAANPNHAAGGFPRTCESCHNIQAWRPAKFDHTAAFPLTGAHEQAACTRCHTGGRYQGTPKDCFSCHQPDYARTTNPNHQASGFATQCQNCHTTVGWKPAGFNHDRFPLTGAHSRTDCTKCHAGGRYQGTPSDCLSCHQANYNSAANPNHVAGNFPKTCQTCHTTSAWRPASVDHSQTRFPLTGSHARVDCARCHTGGRYTGTPTDCWSCHQSNYSGTTNPNHAAGGFPHTCQTCHTTNAWRPATVDHSQTRFPLTGAHARVDCARCHTGGRYTGTPTDCWSCHQSNYSSTTNPNHVAGNFPHTCQSCHTTNAWRPATVDHSQTRFPLTGAHASVDCTRCHTGGRYTGTPTDCWSCHQSNYAATTNPNHASASFPTQCESCHNTSAWRPSTFDHDGRYFPIYSGTHRGRWSSCSECHVTASNFKAFECILCHEHANRTEVDSKHRGVSGYTYASSACYQCHRTGRANSRLLRPVRR